MCGLPMRARTSRRSSSLSSTSSNGSSVSIPASVAVMFQRSRQPAHSFFLGTVRSTKMAAPHQMPRPSCVGRPLHACQQRSHKLRCRPSSRTRHITCGAKLARHLKHRSSRLTAQYRAAGHRSCPARGPHPPARPDGSSSTRRRRRPSRMTMRNICTPRRVSQR